MLQIFVRKEDADSLAYASRPMGVPLQSFQSIREYPDVFTDSDRVRSFHYCSWPQLCSDIVARGAGAPKTRGSMHREFRRVLQDLLGTHEALLRTRNAVGIGGPPRAMRPVRFRGKKINRRDR